MAPHGRPRRRPEAPRAPGSLHEITRRYVATAIALARAMGVPYTEAFLLEHHSAISCCYIQAGMEGLRLAPGVQLPPLAPAPDDAPEPSNEAIAAHVTAADAPDDAPEAEPDRDPLPLGEGNAPVASPNGDAPTAPSTDNRPPERRPVHQRPGAPTDLHPPRGRLAVRRPRDLPVETRPAPSGPGPCRVPGAHGHGRHPLAGRAPT